MRPRSSSTRGRLWRWLPRSHRRVIVLGGARSGKSTFAERMLARERGVTYVATAPPRPDDPEWQRRVAEHRRRRPASWRTLETTDLDGTLRTESGPLLVDCATLWLAAAMEDCGVWDGDDGTGHGPIEIAAHDAGGDAGGDPGHDPGGDPEPKAADGPHEVLDEKATDDGYDSADARLAARVDALEEAWRSTSARTVLVSNEVGCGIVPATASGRRFRDELGSLNTRLAAHADQVWLVTAGIGRRLR